MEPLPRRQPAPGLPARIQWALHFRRRQESLPGRIPQQWNFPRHLPASGVLLPGAGRVHDHVRHGVHGDGYWDDVPKEADLDWIVRLAQILIWKDGRLPGKCKDELSLLFDK
jgi:hypothetical protein